MGGGPKETLIQLRHIDGQQTYEKMINITNHQGNANQNHSELSPHTHQNSYHWTELKKKKKKQSCNQQMLERVWGKGNTLTLLVGM